MCKQLEISRAAYYKWLHREIPEHELKNIELAELIKEYDERFNHILGYGRMTSWINHFNHTNYSKKRVHRIMQKLDIHAVIRKKKKTYRSSTPDETAENKLGRDFYANAPNKEMDNRCNRIQSTRYTEETLFKCHSGFVRQISSFTCHKLQK